MENDKTGDNEKELTSTSSPMGKLLSTNQEEKNDSNDTLPTSSTDANIFSDNKSSQSVSEDPISSTSNEMDSTKIKSVTDPPVDVVDRISTIDTDAELLGISISAESNEKIEENVYDLVNDLETLLGESTDAFTIPSRSTPAPQQKTEAPEPKAECSLPNQKTEDEVSSYTDIAAGKSAPSDDPASELSLVQPAALQLSKPSVDSETPIEVDTVVDESESSNTNITTDLIKTNDVESKLVNTVETLNKEETESIAKEQPQLLFMEEEELEQSALIKTSSCDANKDLPNLVEEQETQETAMIEECEKEPNLVSADMEKTAQQTAALEELKSNPNEEEPKPVSDVSEENIQETHTITEEPKGNEKQIQEPETVKDSNSMPNEETLKLVSEEQEQDQETATTEELNSKTNEEQPKLVSETDEEKKQELTTAEELDFTTSEEEVKLIRKAVEEEKQETITPEESNSNTSEKQPILISKVHDEEKEETETVEDIGCKANEEEEKPISAVDEDRKQETATPEEPSLKASEEEPKLISEVHEEEKQETAISEEPKANEEELESVGVDVEMEIHKSENAEQVSQILFLEVEKELKEQSMEVESDNQKVCEVGQAEPEQSISSDIHEVKDLQQKVEFANTAENAPELSEELKTESSISMELQEEISEAKQDARKEESDDHQKTQQHTKDLKTITSQSGSSHEKLPEVIETAKTEVEEPTIISIEVPTSKKSEESSEAENIISPNESEDICEIPSEETVETIKELIAEDSKSSELPKEETRAAQMIEEIEITELVEAAVPKDAEIIDADPVVEEPDETTPEAEDVATIPEIVETDNAEVPVEIQVVEEDNTATVEESLRPNKPEEPEVAQEIPVSKSQTSCVESALKVEEIPVAPSGSTEKSVVEIGKITVEEVEPADEPNETTEEILVEEIRLTDQVNEVDDSEKSEPVEVPELAQESKMIVEEPVVVAKESEPSTNEVESTKESKLTIEELAVGEVDATQISELTGSGSEEKKVVDEPAKKSELTIPVEKTEATGDSKMEIVELPETEATLIVEDIPIGEIKSSDVSAIVIDVDEASDPEAVGDSKPIQVDDIPEVIDESAVKIDETVTHNKETPTDDIPEVSEESVDKIIETVTLSEETLTEGIAEVIGESVVKLNETVASNDVINLIEDSLEAPSDITQNIDKTTLILPEEPSELSKPLPEMSIRRKTVEQDLEKVVCLSEESSDSDDAAPVISTAKPIDEEQPFEIDQLLESQIDPCESQDIPEIEEILAEQPTSIEAAVESASSFETMLAVASLQNEVVPSVREERRLSDKEIQEMEAIRMAVASITDSSQDTYDSFLVDSSVPLESQEVADVPSIEGLVSEDAMQATSEDSAAKLVDEAMDVSTGKSQVEKPELDSKISLVKGEVASREKENLKVEASVDETNNLDKSKGNELLKSEEQVLTIEKTGTTIPEVAMTEDSAKEEVQAGPSIKTPVSEKLPIQAEESVAVLVEKPPSPIIAETLPVEPMLSVAVPVVESVTIENEAFTISAAPEAEDKLTESVDFSYDNPEPVPSLTVAKEADSNYATSTSIKTEVPVASGTIGIINLEKAKENCVSVTTTEITESKDASVANKPSTEERPLRTRSRRGNKVSEPLSINVDEVEKKEVCSPKIIIKPVKAPEEEISTSSSASETESNKGSLKMTITKQADKMHSILKVFNPDEEVQSPQAQEEPIPKLIIKQVQQIDQQQHSPKMSTRGSKGYSPTSPRCSSPRVTIKPVAKPVEVKTEALSPIKITFKPVVKPEETARKHSPKPPKDLEKNHNPKITIKLIPKPAETEKEETVTTPKVTIKPLKRPAEEAELDVDQERSSPKITIKPVIKPPDHDFEQTPAPSTPKLKIKPIKKHEEEESVPQESDHSSPKISIKPVVKPSEQEEEELDDVKERIVLKINRGNLPAAGRESKKREYPEDDKAEKVGIKLKFSTTGGHTHIVQGVEESNKRQRKDSGYSGSVAVKKESEEASLKRPLDDRLPEKNKRMRNSMSPEKHINNDLSANVEPPADLLRPSEPQDISTIANLAAQTTHIGATPVLTVGVVTPTVTPTPKRRGRPRKVPLEVRPELSTPEISPAPSTVSSDVDTPLVTPPVEGRPKRSCRGQNVMATLGIKPRKPRGRGRGSKVNMGDRTPPVVQTPVEPMVEETVSDKPKKDPVNPDNGGSSRKEEETEEKLYAETLPETSVKKKKEDKTPVRKLEVTTRRQKAQLQKEGDEKSPEVSPESLKDQRKLSESSSSKPAENLTSETSTDDVEFVSEKKYKLDEKLLKQKEFLERSAPHENEIEIITIEDDSKNPDDLDEEDESSDEESESEKRRAYVLKKKQEALRKCREKRKEKLARVAEMKKKRMQLREAKKAAEEAEKAAAEKARATKRYGRYGVPKPQISLVDQPVPETSGTVKSLSNAGGVTEDENSDKDRPGLLTPVKSSECMLVDPLEETPVKRRASVGREDVVMVDEETRMSADFRGSRAQTPAKQPNSEVIVVEDSQGSVGTEGGKSRSSKAPKMEVFQDLESVFTADQLAEYSWNGQGPFMLQEQVTQFLAIKSFKRKYPNVTRRPVDMQERDYLKENHLVTESQCDLGLTAVLAQDILDIMYTDFQDKYEEYCRAQREKQARELADKQRALNQVSLKPGFDKLDILEQAVQSVASWNQQFNKARREQRKAYMDLQNLTIHYPKSKMKVIPAPKVGHYPVALVPGQFIDYYKEYTPTELNNLPLNTMCYDEIKIPTFHTYSDDSTSGSESESESDSSSSGSSCDDEHCKDCVKKGKKTNGVRETDSDDVVIIENDASSSDSVVLVSVTEAITA